MEPNQLKIIQNGQKPLSESFETQAKDLLKNLEGQEIEEDCVEMWENRLQTDENGLIRRETNTNIQNDLSEEDGSPENYDSSSGVETDEVSTEFEEASTESDSESEEDLRKIKNPAEETLKAAPTISSTKTETIENGIKMLEDPANFLENSVNNEDIPAESHNCTGLLRKETMTPIITQNPSEIKDSTEIEQNRSLKTQKSHSDSPENCPKSSKIAKIDQQIQETSKSSKIDQEMKQNLRKSPTIAEMVTEAQEKSSKSQRITESDLENQESITKLQRIDQNDPETGENSPNKSPKISHIELEPQEESSKLEEASNRNKKKKKRKKSIEPILPEDLPFPGTLMDWYSNLCSIKKHDLASLIQSDLELYCDSSTNNNYYGQTLKTQPTKFLLMFLLNSLILAEEDDPEHFEKALSDLCKLKSLLELYAKDLRQFYNLEGFYFLIQSLLHTLDPLGNFGRGNEILNKNRGNNLSNKNQENYYWLNMNPQAQKEIYAVKLCFHLLFKDLDNCPLLIAILREENVPEWQLLCCLFHRLKRHQNNIPIVKPKKMEMDFLRKALDLEPSNLAVRVLLGQTLFDWMRTDDRKPRIEILGEILTDVDDIAQFVHLEFQDLHNMETSSKPLALELLTFLSRFYSYKNLPNLLTRRTDTVEMHLKDIKHEEDILIFYDLFSKQDASDLSNYFLKKAMVIQPRNPEAAISKAFKALRTFNRSEALHYLKISLELNAFHEQLIVVYIRTLVGGTVEDQETAFKSIDTYLRHSTIFSTSFQVHLYFLQGILHWAKESSEEVVRPCVQAWIQGLYLNSNLFLNQFSFWSKTQIRKYLWPSELCEFRMVAKLKEALGLLANLTEQSFEDPRTPGASAAFLDQMNLYFPATWKMTEELSTLCKEWFYLLESNESQSESDSSSEESEDEEYYKENYFEFPEKSTDLCHNSPEVVVIPDEGDDGSPEVMEIPQEEPETSIYMDLPEPAAFVVPFKSPPLPSRRPNLIQVNILPDFFMSTEPIAQSSTKSAGKPIPVVILD